LIHPRAPAGAWSIEHRVLRRRAHQGGL